MNIRQTKLFIVQAEVILEKARKLEGLGLKTYRENNVSYLYLLDNIDVLIKQYNLLVPKINKLLESEQIDEKLETIKETKATLNQIREDNILFNSDQKLLQLIFGSSNILSFLREGVVLSEISKDKLDYIEKELQELKDELAEGVYLNLEQAKLDFEKGSFLGSSLISGRVIISSLNKINGKDINERIEKLKALNLIREKDGKDFILKANHFGRNVTSHDLSIIPSASETISHLGDAVKVAKISADYGRLIDNFKETKSATLSEENKIE